MATKYKPILKSQKKLFNTVYERVHNPNLTRNQNIQNTINAMSNLLSGYIGTSDEKEAQLSAVAQKAIIDELNGQLVHYYIKDKSLISFLENTEIKDTSIIDEYVRENKLLLTFKDSYYSIALHTENSGLLITYLMNNKSTTVIVFDDMHSFNFNLKAKLTDPLCKIAVNLIYYMKAFPEKVLEGVPDDMVKNDKKKVQDNKNYSIGIADEIVEKSEYVNGHLVSPHFRSGFFRHYTDDRYINMKGKVQFIAATMVKGKAKTVVA